MRITIPRHKIQIPGYQFAGVACGLKEGGKRDLALIFSQRPAVAAAAFTTNRIQAAPVQIGKRLLRGGWLQAAVINSGHANACTGPAGFRLAQNCCRLVARLLGIDERVVIPSSTGRIGVPVPWRTMRRGIRQACQVLSPKSFFPAAEAILTTDAFSKTAVRRLRLGGKKVTVGAMAKGAGMIAPQMVCLPARSGGGPKSEATLLAYIMTDARVSFAALREVLAEGLARSFNIISVDGDTSTNDTVILMANGLAGNRQIEPGQGGFFRFRETVVDMMRELARMMVVDGEGATKVVEIQVKGAKTGADARRVARAVAHSLLVKTAFHGEDPNWGRIACAVGYAGARIAPSKLDIALNGIPLVRRGQGLGARTVTLAAREMEKAEFRLTIHLHGGPAEAALFTSDLSPEYVKFNSAYRT